MCQLCIGKPEARLLAAEGVLTDSIQAITDCFQTQRMMKPNIRQPVGHISLSYAPEDAPRMTDEMLVSLAKEYMQKMGIRDTQYIIAGVDFKDITYTFLNQRYPIYHCPA